MKATILFIFLISALSVKAQQYYKVVRFDETTTGTTIRINSTVTSNYIEQFIKKPLKQKRKDLLKTLIVELRKKDSISLSTPGKVAILPKYFDNKVKEWKI